MDQLSPVQALAKMAAFGLLYIDLLGYLACFAVLVASCMQTMLPLRLVGACSNIAFITYALLASLRPIFTLHCVLLAINVGSLLRCTVFKTKTNVQLSEG